MLCAFVKRVHASRDEDTCWHGCKGAGACVLTHPRQRILVRLPAKAPERVRQLLQRDGGDKHAILVGLSSLDDYGACVM